MDFHFTYYAFAFLIVSRYSIKDYFDYHIRSYCCALG